MKIMWHKSADRGASRTIHEGFQDACINDLHCEYFEWDFSNINEVFDKEQPDVYIADCRVKFPLPKYLREHRCKIVCGTDQRPLKGHPPLFKDLANEGYITNIDHIEWIKELSPDLLFHCSHDSSIHISHAGWFEDGWKVVGFPLAGNPHKFKLLRESEWVNRPYDITYAGGFFPSKQVGLCALLVPCMMYAKTVIIGDGWPWPVNKTFIKSEELCAIWNETKIAPCINQSIVRYNDSYVDSLLSTELAERFYNSALCGCLVITDSENTVKKNLGEIDSQWFPATSNIDKFHNIIKNTLILEPSSSIIECLNHQRAVILEKHCYSNRLKSLLSYVGINI